MNILQTIRNYYFYCGIERGEYRALKKEAYISNFKVWKILHILMTAVFGSLYLTSLANGLLRTNAYFYRIGLIYSAAALLLFFVLKKDSLLA